MAVGKTGPSWVLPNKWSRLLTQLVRRERAVQAMPRVDTEVYGIEFGQFFMVDVWIREPTLEKLTNNSLDAQALFKKYLLIVSKSMKNGMSRIFAWTVTV